MILPIVAAIKNWKVGGYIFAGTVATAAVVVADPSPSTPWLLAALIPIGIFICGQLLYAQRTRTGEREQLLKRITVLETQVTPFWASLQTALTASLHRPHRQYYEKDRLMEKLDNLTITPEETARLKILLEQVEESGASEEEKAKAHFLRLAMPLVISERHSGRQ
jgi:hypothetical protein